MMNSTITIFPASGKAAELNAALNVSGVVMNLENKLLDGASVVSTTHRSRAPIHRRQRPLQLKERTA